MHTQTRTNNIGEMHISSVVEISAFFQARSWIARHFRLGSPHYGLGGGGYAGQVNDGGAKNKVGMRL